MENLPQDEQIQLSSKKSLIREEIKFNSKLTCLKYNLNMNCLAVGDEKGRISFYDTRDSKPFKLFLSDRNNEDGETLYFSQKDKILYYDIRSEKKIYSEKDSKKFTIKGNENFAEENFLNLGEINDFDIINQSIIWNDQDNDKFFICKLNRESCEENLIDIFTLSSAFTQTFTKPDECILCSFDGNFIKYNFKEKKTKSDKNVKNYLTKEMKESYGNYLTNPPFINKILFNKFNDHIFFGLMNGVILSLKNNLKTNFVKSFHNGAIRDLKLFYQTNLNEIVLTLGRDKSIKAIDNEGEVRLCVDLSDFDNEDPFVIESNNEGDIYYLDENSNNLKIVKLKK